MKNYSIIIVFLFLGYSNVFGQANGLFDGDIQSSTLLGTDDRNVVAQPDGTLKIGTDKSIKYLSISASAFHPTVDDGNAYFSNIMQASYLSTSTNGVGFIAPVSLPHNSEIITVTYYYWDLNVPVDCVFKLNEYDLNSNTINGGYAPIANSSGSAGNGVVNISLTSSFIDNVNHSYSVTMEPPNFSTSLDNTFQMRGVRITYK